MKTIEITILGLVQQVGYRKFCKIKASEFNITGWVQNQLDGSVKACAQGKKIDLEHFIYALKIGPSKSKPTDFLSRSLSTNKIFNTFEIL